MATAGCKAGHAQSYVTIYGLLDLSVGISDTGEVPRGRAAQCAPRVACNDRALSKRTSPYASYGSSENNERARTPLHGAIPLVGPNGYGSDPRALSAGVHHRF